MGGPSPVSLSPDLSISSTTDMNMDGTASIARTTMRIMIVKTPTGSSNRSSTRHLSWGMVGSVVMESDEKASVVEIQERVGVEADVASGVAVVSVVEVACREDGTTGVSVVTTEGALMVEVSVVTTEGALMVDAEVEEKAKERTVVALLVDPEEALLVGAGEEASEGTATEEPVVEAKEEIVEEAVVEAKEETVVESVVEAVVEAVVESVVEAKEETVVEASTNFPFS